MKFLSVEDTSTADKNVIFVFQVVREVARMVRSGLIFVLCIGFFSRKRLILQLGYTNAKGVRDWFITYDISLVAFDCRWVIRVGFQHLVFHKCDHLCHQLTWRYRKQVRTLKNNKAPFYGALRVTWNPVETIENLILCSEFVLSFAQSELSAQRLMLWCLYWLI